MNWITNYVRPKINSMLGRREMPENLWIKDPETGEMVFHKDLESNQFVIPSSGHHMKISAKERLALWLKRFLPGVLEGEVWSRERVDYLVNNGGSGGTAPVAETTEATFDTLVGVHFKGPFFLTQKLLPLLADGGRVVNVTTGLTRYSAGVLRERRLSAEHHVDFLTENSLHGRRIPRDIRVSSALGRDIRAGSHQSS